MSQVSGPQLVPHSLESEEAVIGAVLINPEAIDYEVAFLKSDDFYIHRNRWIWEVFIRLHSKGIPIDFVTVCEELDKTGHLADIGGSAYITKISGNVPSSFNAGAYGERVQETAIRRRMLTSANVEAKDAYDEEKDINEAIAEAQTRLGKLVIVKEKIESVAVIALDVMDTVLERINLRASGQKIEVGFQTGIGYIDRNLKGLKKGWLVMFAGKPKVGKSWLVAQIAKSFANQKPGVYISLEMDKESMLYRLLSMDIGVTSTDVELGNVEADAVVHAVEKMNPDLFLWCTTGLTITQLQAFVAKQIAERGIEWIVIDYVDLMVATERKRNETEEDKTLWNELKTKIALEMNILVIAIESVNKLAADGIMSDDKVVGAYAKIHAVDLAFGYSPYHAKPHKGLPEIEDGARELRCRVLNTMADRHRGTTGILMGLEYYLEGDYKGFVYDLEKEEKEDRSGLWMGPQ